MASKSLEEYRKQVEKTRQILLARKDGGGGGGEEAGSTAAAKPSVPTAPTPRAPAPAPPTSSNSRTPAPPKKKDATDEERPSSSVKDNNNNSGALPLPPPSPSHERAAAASSIQRPPPRSPRPSSFRRTRKLSNTAPSTSAPPTGERTEVTQNAVPTRQNGNDSASIPKPEASPRTKAKELIGETLANLRKRAQPFANGSKSKAPDTSVKEVPQISQAPMSHIQTNVNIAEALPAGKQKTAGSSAKAVARTTAVKGKDKVSALLQDATLAHKKVDALLEAEQRSNSIKENGDDAANGDVDGPQAQFIDRLYHSLTKLKHLEKSRNRMNLCADGMEASVKSLNQFVHRVDSERDRDEKLELRRKANAKAVIQTNASLLTTEISLLLRSYEVEQRQIEDIKGSIGDFLQTVFEQMEKV